MPDRLPSLTGLRAFEVTARRSSFTRAAEELNVTQGAVSHAVKALELELGRKLFARAPGRLTLTEDGRRLVAGVRDAFERLRLATEEIRGRTQDRHLTVSVSPSFAHKWLGPRIGRFAAAHPEIDLRLAASIEHVDLVRGDVDMVVRHGDGNWPELSVTRLCTEEVFPVCAPELRRELPGESDLSSLRGAILMRVAPGGVDWQDWFAAAGVSGVQARGPEFSDASLALEAAMAGQGVALTRTALAAADLLAGRLVRPFKVALPAPFSYWIACLKAKALQPKIKLFREWLLAQAAIEAGRLAEIDRAKPAKRRFRRP
jgi:LysR family transcriptional regulator, glycine cleavage system transcriptional activator